MKDTSADGGKTCGTTCDKGADNVARGRATSIYRLNSTVSAATVAEDRTVGDGVAGGKFTAGAPCKEVGVDQEVSAKVDSR